MSPIRVYLCDKCENEQEIEQRLSDDIITNCPICGEKENWHCVPQAPIVTLFRGPGFYCNDVKRNPEEKLNPIQRKRHNAAVKRELEMHKRQGTKPRKVDRRS